MDGDYIGYGLYAVAYGTSIAAFLMTKINHLRILFVVSSGCYALYYFIFPLEPLWLDVVSEGAFVVINLCMLSYVLWGRSRTQFSSQEKHIYDACFAGLETHEFKKILAISDWRVLEPGQQPIYKNQPVTNIYYLFSGEVEILRDHSAPITRRAGTVLGEISYMLEEVASADVFVKDRCLLLVISQQKLQKICKKNDRIGAAVEAMMASQAATKLAAI